MRRSFGVTVALCRRQLGSRLALRIATWVGALVSAAVVLAAALAADGLALAALAADGLRLLCWVGAAPVAVAVASSPQRRDRDEGVAAMCAAHGVGPLELRRARTVAAMLACAARIVVPASAMYLLMAGLAGSATLLIHGLGALFVALAVGSVTGLLASACGHFGRERGVLLLAVLVLLPWVLEDALALQGVSLPTLVDASITRLTAAIGPLGIG